MRLNKLLKVISLKTKVAVYTPMGIKRSVLEELSYGFLKDWGDYQVEDIEQEDDYLKILLGGCNG